jgi:hypothetical protein
VEQVDREDAVMAIQPVMYRGYGINNAPGGGYAIFRQGIQIATVKDKVELEQWLEANKDTRKKDFQLMQAALASCSPTAR